MKRPPSAASGRFFIGKLENEMNRQYFFQRVKDALFGGRLSQTQVDGLTKILDYAEVKYPSMDGRWLAYILATAKHETAHTMQPVREMGGEAYLKSKPYYPWVGEGLVQVTWEVNHRKFGGTKPGMLLTWPIALNAIFLGMTKGLFTGKKLSDYISGGKCDYVGARRIVNGTDKAALIAGYAKAFQEAIEQAKEPAAVHAVSAPEIAEDGPPPSVVSRPVSDGPVATGTPAMESNTVLAQVGSVATAVGVPVAAAIGGIDWKIAAVIVIGGVLAFGIWTIAEQRKQSREKGV
jgi:putative chitinase